MRRITIYSYEDDWSRLPLSIIFIGTEVGEPLDCTELLLLLTCDFSLGYFMYALEVLDTAGLRELKSTLPVVFICISVSYGIFIIRMGYYFDF